MLERRDLFGRTEAELVAAIARARATYAIAEVYRGNEGIALNLARRLANIRVLERCLAQLRGERVVYPEGEEPRPPLSGQALARWREDIARMARTSRAR